MARFARDEAHLLKPFGGQPPFGWLRKLARVVGNDCAVEIDKNSYSVPWRLIGERVAVRLRPARYASAMACARLRSTSNRRVARCGSSIPLTSTGLPVAMARSADRQRRHRH